jgi:hypothetical protein
LRQLRSLLLTLTAAVLLAGASSALEVRLTVNETAGAERKGGTVTSGVPLPRGAVKDPAKLSVSAAGKKIPAQFGVLARWPDGSLRWVLLNCRADVPAKGKTALVLSDSGGNPAPPKAVGVTDGDAELKISTGPLEMVVDKKGSGLIRSIKVDGKELVTSKGRGLVLFKADKQADHTVTSSRKIKDWPQPDPGEPVLAAAPAEVKVEENGPVRAVVLLRGKFPGVHEGKFSYSARIYAFAGARSVKLRVWIENSGNIGYNAKRKPPFPMQWLLFDGLCLELGLGLGGAPSAECEGVKGSGKLKVYQYCKNGTRQSPEAYGYKNLEYTVTGGGAPKKGAHTDGVVALKGGGGQLVTAMRHFWQNYEKAIELDGSALRYWFFPREGQYPRKFSGHRASYYVGKILPVIKYDGLYHFPGSVHKGHELILDFSGGDAAGGSAELSAPLFALASPEHYAGTEAAPGIFTPATVRTGDGDCNAKLDAWVRMTGSVIDPESKAGIPWARRSLFKKNTPRYGYMYGWMDFGDLASSSSGTSSLHYDWPWITCVSLMRTGDLRYLDMAHEMVRHRVEVDQHWSAADEPGNQGCQRLASTLSQYHVTRLDTAGPNVSETWIAGVVAYHMLTGDRKAREAIDQFAPKIAPYWQKVKTDRNLRRRGGNMQGVARSIFSLCAMHALDGEEKHLDDALGLFKGFVLPKAKSLGPHLHARQQIRSQDYTRDDIKYCYSIHAFCLLHHYTGDEAVMKLLDDGCKQDFPENFFDAPLFLADLHAYVALKKGNQDYLDDAVEHWIEAFPESKCPPVYLSTSSHWTRRGAMNLRTGHLLQYYFWKKKAK